MKVPYSRTSLQIGSTSNYLRSDASSAKKALASKTAAVALPLLALVDFAGNAVSGVVHAAQCLRGKSFHKAHGTIASKRLRASIKGLINIFKYTILLIPNMIKPSLTFNNKPRNEADKKLRQLLCAKKVVKNWKKGFLERKLARLQAEQNNLNTEDGTCTQYLNRLRELNDCVDEHSELRNSPPSSTQKVTSYLKSFDPTSLSDYVVADSVEDYRKHMVSSRKEALNKAKETEGVQLPESLQEYRTPWKSFLSNNLDLGPETVLEEIARQREGVLDTFEGRMAVLQRIDEEIADIKERHGLELPAPVEEEKVSEVKEDASVARRSNFDSLKEDIFNADMFLGVTWNTFLSKFGPDPVSFWMYDKETGDFTMEFKKPLKMWTDLGLFDGGEIFYLDKRVEGKLKDGKMTFSEGFNVVAKFPALGIKQPKILSMEVSGNDTLNVTAKYSFLPSQTIPFPISSLLEGWNYGSELVDGDPAEHIQSKI